LLFRVI